MPYAQRLDLGLVIVGDICVGGVHKQTKVNVYKTSVLPNGRSFFLDPCTSAIQVKETFGLHKQQTIAFSDILGPKQTDCLGLNVLQRNPDDDQLVLSIEDKMFLEIMDSEVYMGNDNHWVAPLPFRNPRPLFPNNRGQTSNASMF